MSAAIAIPISVSIARILIGILRGIGILFDVLIALILVLLLCKTKLRISYRDQKPTLQIRFLFLNFTVYPRKRKKRTEHPVAADKSDPSPVKEPQPDHSKNSAPAPSPQKTDKKEKSATEAKLHETAKNLSIGDYLDILRIIVERFVKKITCEEFRFHVALGGDDPAATAMEYGAIQASLTPILGALSAADKLKRADVSITPDFTSVETRAEAETVLSVRLVHAVGVLIALARNIF